MLAGLEPGPDAELICGSSKGRSAIWRLTYLGVDAPLVASGARGSVILKVARGDVHPLDDEHYWCREAVAYLTRRVPSATSLVRAPTAISIGLDRANRTSALLLEDLGEQSSPASPREMITVARGLGRWYAESYQHPMELPPELRRRSLRRARSSWYPQLFENARKLATLSAQHPLRRVFNAQRLELLDRVFRRSASVERTLAAMPAALLHCDVWTNNVLRTSHGFVLLDWEATMPGPPGSDLSWTRFTLDQQDHAGTTDDDLLSALMAGFDDVGIKADERMLVRAYDLGFALRPALALGGPILSRLLRGDKPIIGPVSVDEHARRLEPMFARIERALAYLPD